MVATYTPPPRRVRAHTTVDAKPQSLVPPASTGAGSQTLGRATSAVARRFFRSQQVGLVLVLLVLGTGLSLAAGSHVDAATGRTVNNFLNEYTLIQMATDASGFAVMGVGATIVIIAGGIDLSVGAIYALAGVTMAMTLRAAGPMGDGA